MILLTSCATLEYSIAEELNPQTLGSVIADADLASKYEASGGVPSILR